MLIILLINHVYLLNYPLPRYQTLEDALRRCVNAYQVIVRRIGINFFEVKNYDEEKWRINERNLKKACLRRHSDVDFDSWLVVACRAIQNSWLSLLISGRVISHSRVMFQTRSQLFLLFFSMRWTHTRRKLTEVESAIIFDRSFNKQELLRQIFWFARWLSDGLRKMLTVAITRSQFQPSRNIQTLFNLLNKNFSLWLQASHAFHWGMPNGIGFGFNRGREQSDQPEMRRWARCRNWDKLRLRNFWNWVYAKLWNMKIESKQRKLSWLSVFDTSVLDEWKSCVSVLVYMFNDDSIYVAKVASCS